MNVAEILHAILNIAAGDGAQKWLHDEIDKLDQATEPQKAGTSSEPTADIAGSGFLPAPGGLV